MRPELLGCLAALGSAFFFSYAATLFQRLSRHLTPVAINLGKGCVALALTGAALLVTSVPHLSYQTHLLLGLSGLLGITIGDTAYFYALRELGARRTLLFDTLGPALTALTAGLVLHEHLTVQQWAGCTLTLAGVAVVVRSDAASSALDATRSPWSMRGALWALLSLGCHTAGVLLAKQGLFDAPPLAGSFLRQLWAVAALFVLTAVTSQRQQLQLPSEQRSLILGLLGRAAFFGTFLGIWLSQVGLHYTSASLAVTLNSTGPLFVLALARVLHGEPARPQAWIGTSIAVLGVIALLRP